MSGKCAKNFLGFSMSGINGIDMREALQRIEQLESQQVTQLSAMQKGFGELTLAVKEQNTELKLLRQELVGALTGKEQIPLPVAMVLFKSLCWVIVALVIWFTGVKYFAGVM